MTDPKKEAAQFAAAFFHLAEVITKNDEMIHAMLRRLRNMDPPEGMPNLSLASVMAAALYLDQNPEEVNNREMVDEFLNSTMATFNRFVLLYTPPDFPMEMPGE